MRILSPGLVRTLGGNVEITSSTLTRNLEFHLGLMEKQIKRVAELGKFLPFADQQEEMNRLVKQINLEVNCLKVFTLGVPDR